MAAFASILARAEAKVSAQVDRFFAEQVEIQPMHATQYTSTPDPQRAIYVTVAVVDTEPQVVAAKQAVDDGGRPAVQLDRILVSFSEAALGERARWPRHSDVIETIDREANLRLRVASVHHDGSGRVNCWCQAVKQ